MADGTSSGLAAGTSGAPQTTLENAELQINAINNEDSAVQSSLISELESRGTKFSKNDIVFITKDATGQIVWLEKGNSRAGLQHILNGNGVTTKGHASDFEKAFGVSRSNIPTYLKKAITDGTIISNIQKCVGGREVFERIYQYLGNYYIVTGIGTNGFIVSAYPKRYRKD